MALLEWNDTFSVNVKQVDEEHKKLVELTNKLHDAMRSGQGKMVVGEVLDELVEYTKTHFTHEEALMEKAGYPGLASHKLVHNRLVNQVNDLKTQNEAGKLSLSMEVMKFLKEWLVDHIQGTDKNYSSYLNKNGIT